MGQALRKEIGIMMSQLASLTIKYAEVRDDHHFQITDHKGWWTLIIISISIWKQATLNGRLYDASRISEKLKPDFILILWSLKKQTASDSASQLSPGMYEDSQSQDGKGEGRGVQHFLTDPSMVRKQSD